MSKKVITSGEEWKLEEEFFDIRRRDTKLEIIEKKWSEGSSPIMLVKWGYVTREEWEKCYWLDYPSVVRCFECKHIEICPKGKRI